MKLTKKDIMSFDLPVYVGSYNVHCELVNLLDKIQKIGYTTGIYGWNCNVYLIPFKAIICTGYRTPAGKKLTSEILVNLVK